jgi:hypothetical protein
MNKKIILAGFAVVFLAGVYSYAGLVDFSGNWVLSKSLPRASAPGTIKLGIRQSGNDLVIVQTTIRDGESSSLEARYTLDGSENTNIEPNTAGDITIKSKSRWNNGTLVLEGSSTFAGPNGDVSTKWKREYSLSADGTTLTLVETHPTPFGEAVITKLFTRE